MQISERGEFLELIEARFYLPRGSKLWTGEKRRDEAISDNWWQALRHYPLERVRSACIEVLRTCRFKPQPSDVVAALEKLNSNLRERSLESRRCSFTSGTRQCTLRGTHHRHEGDPSSGWLCALHDETRGSIEDGIRVLDEVERNGPPYRPYPGDEMMARGLLDWGMEDFVLEKYGARMLRHLSENPEAGRPPPRDSARPGTSRAVVNSAVREMTGERR